MLIKTNYKLDQKIIWVKEEEKDDGKRRKKKIEDCVKHIHVVRLLNQRH